MADDPVRDLLAGVQPASMIVTAPGTTAVLISRVVEAGGDPDAVAEWVRARGGQISRTEPMASRGLRRGRMTPRTEPGVGFYVVPADALKP